MKKLTKLLSLVLSVSLAAQMISSVNVNATKDSITFYDVKNSILDFKSYNEELDTNHDGNLNVFDVIRFNKTLIQEESYTDLKEKVYMLETQIESLYQKLNEKTDIEEGKQLSSNDYTDEEKQKLEILNNYDDTEIKNEIADIKSDLTQLNEDIDEYLGNKLEAKIEHANSYIMANGAIVDGADGWNVYKIKVSGFSKITTYVAVADAAGWVFYNSNNERIAGSFAYEYYHDAVEHIGYMILDVPEGSEYILITNHTTVNPKGINVRYIVDNELSQIKEKINAIGFENQLYGKKINMIGDSYVANNGRPVSETWHYKLANKYNMVYRNYGINGNLFVIDDGDYTYGQPVINRYTEMDNDADYVGIICGHNEMTGCGDVISESEYKTYLRTFFTGMINKYPKAKIFYVSPWGINQVPNAPYNGFNNGINWVSDVCKEFNIAMFDCRRSNMYMGNTAFMTEFCQSSSDYAHLNNKGHDRFLPTMEQFLLGI